MYMAPKERWEGAREGKRGEEIPDSATFMTAFKTSLVSSHLLRFAMGCLGAFTSDEKKVSIELFS